jgi:hypothetical protein
MDARHKAGHDGEGEAARQKPKIHPRRMLPSQLHLQLSAIRRQWLDFRPWVSMFAQPLGSMIGPMRNIITKLLIAVAPRRIAGDG